MEQQSALWNYKIELAFGLIALVAAIKQYFKGGVCKADRDLTGKTVIITGGNSGLGKATVEALAVKNCTIIFGARDNQKS